VDDQLVEAAIADFSRYLHTGMPGKAVAWNSEQQTATIRPMVYFVDGDDLIVIPDLPDVLVQYPGCGDLFLTFPIDVGAECLITFSERCIDSWWDTGDLGDVLSMRLHDLSDGFAHFGFNSKGRAVPNPDKDAIAIRTRAGNAFVKVTKDGEVIIDGTKLTVLCPTEMMQTQKVVGAVTMESTADIVGITTVKAAIVGQGGMAVSGGTGASVSGNLVHTDGKLTSNGISVDGHHHTEHDGPSTSGPIG